MQLIQPRVRPVTAVETRAADAPTELPPDALASLAASAGIDPERADAAVQQELAGILDIVVQGLIEVLRSRAHVKSQFRMPVTSVRPVENNPLKFSMNAREALHNLFVRRNPGYLPAAGIFPRGVGRHQRSPARGAGGCARRLQLHARESASGSVGIAVLTPLAACLVATRRPPAALLGFVPRAFRGHRKESRGVLPVVVRRGVRAGLRGAAAEADRSRTARTRMSLNLFRSKPAMVIAGHFTWRSASATAKGNVRKLNEDAVLERVRCWPVGGRGRHGWPQRGRCRQQRHRRGAVRHAQACAPEPASG